MEEFITDHMSSVRPLPAAGLDETSGVLALALRAGGADWVMWFRPEVIRTVQWAGNPSKPVVHGGGADDATPRLHPRRSFAAYAETVRDRSRPWEDHEVAAARALRGHLVDIVLRQAEETERLNAELRRSNDELDAFTWIAGHDLKEPLRGVRTYAEALRDDGLSSDEARLVTDRLVRLGGRMETMLESLLEYARAGHTELEPEDVDLDGVLRDVLEMMRSRIAEAGADVRVPRPLPRAACDPVRVGSVLQNLIGNALKYRSEADPWVEIGWSGDGGVPVYHVADNGIGVAHEHWDAIFELFRRLHEPSRYGGGAGAGLTIARRLVERHGGRLWLESEPGRGSKFLFTLGRDPADGHA